MDIRARRVALPAVLAGLFLALLGWRAVPARAEVDPTLVAESISEDGYYIDSQASYLKSDAEQERLRGVLDKLHHPAFVAVLPAGANSSRLLATLPSRVHRKGTYAALVGSKLTARSTTFRKATLARMLSQAKRSNPDPGKAVVAFLGLFDHKDPAHALGKAVPREAKGSPAAEPSDNAAADPSTTPVAAAKKDSGSGLLYVGGGAVIVIAAAAGGYLFWRSRRNSAASEPSQRA